MLPNHEQFVQHVVDSGLLSEQEIRAFLHRLPPDARTQDPVFLARRLVNAGKLTMYQASALFKGKSKSLVLGDYVILDRIGGGGMGEVFRARHRRLGRMAAVKVLPQEALSSSAAVQRFHQEVKAAARLNHINVVHAYDCGEKEGIHFLIMEFVEGRDLAALLKQQGPLPPEEAVRYILEAARGLNYAHQQGIIHRDIKPGNLVLNSQGVVKILDMGLARIDEVLKPSDFTTEARLTTSGVVVGTVDYMAPEQAVDSRLADHRSDIYSLGCTLYELLTGRPPYPRSTFMQTFLAHREANIPSPRAEREELPVELDIICRRMMAKDPRHRYQSVIEVIADLTALQSGRPLPYGGLAASPPTFSGRPVEPPPIECARHTTVDAETRMGPPPALDGQSAKPAPLWIWAAVAMLLLAVAGVVLLLWLTSLLKRPDDDRRATILQSSRVSASQYP